MSNSEHLERIRQGVMAWNQWRASDSTTALDLREADLSRADLGAKDLRGADLQGADLSGADLQGADLRGADLRGANLVAASLSRVNFSRADLQGADLSVAVLLAADLSGADLSGANLNAADLSGANLSGAILDETVFANVDLTETLGLDACTHKGPSPLDYRTLTRFGQLPLNFLRGCGVPETLITYLPSLSNQPIQFYSCFISYSTVDQDFADRLYADLQHNGVRCWFAPHHIQAGRKFMISLTRQYESTTGFC